VGISLRDFLNAVRREDVVHGLYSQDYQNVAEAAHVIFAVGSYQYAYDLYFMLWQALKALLHPWQTRSTFKDETISLLVPAVVNVARSSYSQAQLANAKLAIEDLMRVPDFLLVFPIAGYTLHAQLADILGDMSQKIGEDLRFFSASVACSFRPATRN